MISGNVLNTAPTLCRTDSVLLLCQQGCCAVLLCQAASCRLYAMIGTDERCHALSMLYNLYGLQTQICERCRLCLGINDADPAVLYTCWHCSEATA